MNNCQDFKTWIINKDLYDEQVSSAAREHLATCTKCREVFEIDEKLEADLKREFQKVSLPAGILDRVRGNIEAGTSRDSKQPLRWKFKLLAPALTAAVLLIIFIVNPFTSSIRSLDELGSLALASHQNPDISDGFSAAQVADVSGWFAERLDFRIKLPDFEALGLTLLGGQKCYLRKNEVALLFCNKNGKKVSFFIVNPADLRFKLTRQRNYRIIDDKNTVTIWQNSNLVCITVATV